MRNGQASVLTAVILGVVGIIVVIAVTPFTIVDAGERAVVLRLGAVDRVLSEGIHWVTPLVESVEKLDVKTQKEEVNASAASKDLQNVTAVIALNYHLVPDRVGDLWKSIGYDYKSRIIDPAIQESVKAAVSGYTAEELITKRQVVKDGIKASLTERLVKEFIQVDEVSIVNFDFSASFNQAIEEKVTAEQDALKAKNKLSQSEYEAQQRIATARGEAEAIRIQAQAITQQGGEDYVRLKAIERWDGKLPTQFIPNQTLPFINVTR